MDYNPNWLALLACAVASMVTGFLWYGPLFGKAWMKSVGKDPALMNDPAKMKEMQAKAGPGYVAMFIGSFVTAYVFGHILNAYDTTDIGMGLQGAFWVWLGFIATTALGAKMFEEKSWTYYFVNVGYYLLNLLVYAVILVAWK